MSRYQRQMMVHPDLEDKTKFKRDEGPSINNRMASLAGQIITVNSGLRCNNGYRWLEKWLVEPNDLHKAVEL